MYALDEKDLSILEVMRENAKLSMNKIARKTGIPLATVHHRIKKLERDGIIQKYTIILDKKKLGKKMVAYVLIKATPKSDHIKLMNAVSKHPTIEFASAVTGAFDVILLVRVADIEELNAVVLKYLRTFDEVSETQTMIAYESVEKL